MILKIEGDFLDLNIFIFFINIILSNFSNKLYKANTIIFTKS